MTRKRFMKLAMANGYHRDEAKRWANSKGGHSYSEYYSACVFVWGMHRTKTRIRKIFKDLNRSVRGAISFLNREGAG